MSEPSYFEWLYMFAVAFGATIAVFTAVWYLIGWLVRR